MPNIPRAPAGLLEDKSLEHGQLALFFNLDGTTSDSLQCDGGDVRARLQILNYCTAIMVHSHGVAFISGEAEARLIYAIRDNFPIAPMHGAYAILSNSQTIQCGPVAPVAEVLASASAFVGVNPTVTLSIGPGTVGLSFVNAPDKKNDVRRFMDGHARIRSDLQHLKLKCVSELISKNINKGKALVTFMERDPWFHEKFPIAFGDDVNDIPAGQAAKHAGGLFVWVGNPVGARRAGTDYYLDDLKAVEALLRAFALYLQY